MTIKPVNKVSGIGEPRIDWKRSKITMIAGTVFGLSAVATTYILRLRLPKKPLLSITTVSALFSVVCIYKLIAFRNVILPTHNTGVTASFQDNARCKMTQTSLESHQMRIELIKSAKQSIVFAASYSGKEALDVILEEIKKKLDDGVVVDFSVSPTYLTDRNKNTIRELNKHSNFHGIILDHCFLYDDSILSLPKTVFYHVKGLSIDGGRSMLMGGSSSAGSSDEKQPPIWLYDGKKDLDKKAYLGIAGYHDMDISWESLTDDPSQTGHQLDRQIRQMHQLARHRHSLPPPNNWPEFSPPALPSTGTHQVEFYPSAPEQTHNAFHDALVAKIEAETKSIIFDQMYFQPTDAIFDALVKAADSGVEIQIIHNNAGKGTPDSHYLYVNSSRQKIAQLINHTKNKDRISVYEYNHKHVTLHKKVIIFESQQAVSIGSANIGNNSLRARQADYEISIIVSQQELYEETRSVTETDMSESKKIDNPRSLTLS